MREPVGAGAAVGGDSQQEEDSEQEGGVSEGGVRAVGRQEGVGRVYRGISRAEEGEAGGGED